MTRTLGTDDGENRAISDVIAFTIVFSIIITSVGIISAVGFTTLGDIQDNERSVNARRAMQSLNENLGEIQRGHAPGRAGEIEVGDGVITIDAPEVGGGGTGARLNVTVNRTVGGSQLFSLDRTVGSLYYNVGDEQRRVAIESGAVFGATRDGQVMVDPPRMTCGSDYALVSVIRFEAAPNANTTLSGGTVQIEGRETRSELVWSNTDGSTETVNLTVPRSDFQEAWIRGLERNGWEDPAPGDNAVECSGVERVFVRTTVIEIDFLG